MSYHPPPQRPNDDDHGRREVLSRPSATSLEYQGRSSITSQSAPSINNIIEKQIWERRTGISDDFDPERRGHTVSRAPGGGDDAGAGSSRGGVATAFGYDRNNPSDGDSYQCRNSSRNDNNHRYQRERSRDSYDDRAGEGNNIRSSKDRNGGYREEGNRHHSSNASFDEDSRGRNQHNDRNPGRRDSYQDDHHQHRSRNPNGDADYANRQGYTRDRRPFSQEYCHNPPRNPSDQYSNRRDGPDNDNRRPSGNYASRVNERDRYGNDPRDDRPRRDSRSNNDGRRGSSIASASGGGRNQHEYHHNSSSSQQQNQPTPPGDDGGGWETVPSRADRRSSGAPREIEPPAPKITYLPRNDSNSKYQQFMLLLAGVPGSGKSTLAESLVAGKPWMYVRVNQDTLGSRRNCEDLTRKVLEDGKCPIIDRCNFDPTQRKHFLSIAASFKVPVDCIVFQYDMSLCIRRCQARRNHETITTQIAVEVVQRMVQQFSPPLPSRINAETFRNLKTIASSDAFNDVVLEYLNLI